MNRARIPNLRRSFSTKSWNVLERATKWYNDITTKSPDPFLANKKIVADKILGCVYGSALGDAYGLATEFMTKPRILEWYGNEPIPFPKYKRNMHNINWTRGDWTDDTDQMILILDSIVENNGKILPEVFARKLAAWSEDGFPELGDTSGAGLGQTVSRVVQHPDFFTYPHKSAELIWKKYDENLAANGKPVDFSFRVIPDVIQNTLDMCKVTHFDTRCQATCVLQTTAIAQMILLAEKKEGQINDEEVENIIRHSIDYSLNFLHPKYKTEFMEHVNVPGTLEGLQSLKLEGPGMGYTFKCIGAGLWGLRRGTDFKNILNTLIKEGGDADTNGAVCGALIGARIGYSNLPKDWLDALVDKWWLDEKMKRFLYLMGLPLSDEPKNQTSSV